MFDLNLMQKSSTKIKRCLCPVSTISQPTASTSPSPARWRTRRLWSPSSTSRDSYGRQVCWSTSTTGSGFCWSACAWLAKSGMTIHSRTSISLRSCLMWASRWSTSWSRSFWISFWTTTWWSKEASTPNTTSWWGRWRKICVMRHSCRQKSSNEAHAARRKTTGPSSHSKHQYQRNKWPNYSKTPPKLSSIWKKGTNSKWSMPCPINSRPPSKKPVLESLTALYDMIR